MLSQNHFSNQAHKFLVICIQNMFLQHVGGILLWMWFRGQSPLCNEPYLVDGFWVLSQLFSWWVLSFDPFMAFDLLPCHLSLHVSKQRDIFFFSCVLKDDSIPLVHHHFCDWQCHHPHDFHFHTYTWSFTSIKFTSSKKLSGWSSCNTKFDVWVIFLWHFCLHVVNEYDQN